MTENEILKEVVKEFLTATDTNCKKAEDAVQNYDEFFDFVENHIHLKDAMYGFFYKMLDDYILFKFYTSPIPALEDSKEYMEKYKAGVKKTAQTFFNFGGFEVSDEQ